MSKLKIYACSGLQRMIAGAQAMLDWKTNDTLANYLYQAGEYFLYTYIPETDAKSYSKTIQEKRRTQLKVRQYVQDIFVPLYGTEEELDAIIRQGVVDLFNEQLRKKGVDPVNSPEEVIAYLRSTGGIGITEEIAMIICAIIAAVVSVVTGVLTYVLQKWEKKAVIEAQAKYVVPDVDTIADSVAEAEDWGYVVDGGSIKKAGTSWWLIAALAGTALFMGGRFKKSNLK